MAAETATGVNLTVFDPVLKDLYLGKIQDQINSKTVLLKRIARNEENVSGRAAVIPLRAAGSEGMGAVGSGGFLPDPQNQTYVASRIPTQNIYGRILIDGPVISASRNEPGAFTMAVNAEIQNMITDVKRDLNRMLFSDGSGRLARISQTANQATLNVDAPLGWTPTFATVGVNSNGGKYLRANMTVGIFANAATSASTFTTRTITAVVQATAAATATVTFDSAYNATAGDFIVRSSRTGLTAAADQKSTAIGKEVMGLRGIIADSNPGSEGPGAPGAAFQRSGGLQNITVAAGANPFWTAYVNDNGGTLRPLDLDIMQDVQNQADIRGDGTISLAIASHNIVTRKYAGLLQANKRFVNTMELDGGFKALEWNSIPLVWDKDAPPGYMWFVDEATLAIYRQSDFFWLDNDGAVLSRLQDRDAFQGTLALYAELGTTSRNRHGVLEDLDES